MTSDFIKAVMTKMNLIVTTYFEEAPSDASMPYAILQSASIRDDSGYEPVLLDIALYQADTATLDVETMTDNIKAGLHQSIIALAGKFSAHLYFESSDNVRDTDTDLITRRLTFSARVFYL